jgi:hypothetical protein
MDALLAHPKNHGVDARVEVWPDVMDPVSLLPAFGQVGSKNAMCSASAYPLVVISTPATGNRSDPINR